MCNPKSNHLPHQFSLPAPKIAATKYSIKDDDDSFSSYGESGHRENNHKDEISSAFASSSSSSILSLSSFRSVLSNNNNLILATGSACSSNPGIVCSHDYLLVDDRISNVNGGTINNIPIIRFCLINRHKDKNKITRNRNDQLIIIYSFFNLLWILFIEFNRL
ncbi:unnamed protein product [Schistosoma intercalatum]|nr:unnamed protein product [Schistosoma intercalatum]